MNKLNNFNMIPEEEYLDRMEPYYIKKTHLKVNKFSIKMVLQHVFLWQNRKKNELHSQNPSD